MFIRSLTDFDCWSSKYECEDNTFARIHLTWLLWFQGYIAAQNVWQQVITCSQELLLYSVSIFCTVNILATRIDYWKTTETQNNSIPIILLILVSIIGLLCCIDIYLRPGTLQALSATFAMSRPAHPSGPGPPCALRRPAASDLQGPARALRPSAALSSAPRLSGPAGSLPSFKTSQKCSVFASLLMCSWQLVNCK